MIDLEKVIALEEKLRAIREVSYLQMPIQVQFTKQEFDDLIQALINIQDFLDPYNDEEADEDDDYDANDWVIDA